MDIENTLDAADPFDLARFLTAQEAVYTTALRELKKGQKRTHWMWYIFPQAAGLGRSATTQKYAVTGLAEARAYLAHPLLGARLRECTDAVLAVEDRSASAIFGFPDDLKLHSSWTLFDAAAPNSVFAQGLEQYFGGIRDAETLHRL